MPITILIQYKCNKYNKYTSKHLNKQHKKNCIKHQCESLANCYWRLDLPGKVVKHYKLSNLNNNKTNL